MRLELRDERIDVIGSFADSGCHGETILFVDRDGQIGLGRAEIEEGGEEFYLDDLEVRHVLIWTGQLEGEECGLWIDGLVSVARVEHNDARDRLFA